MHARNSRRGARVTLFATALTLLAAGQAVAVEPAADEKERLKACEQKLCSAFMKKTTSGPLACSLTKTWQKSTIEDGVKQKNISWTFGDARCDIDVALDFGEINKAMTEGAHTVSIAPHTVVCMVERENETTEVKITLAPTIKFAGGKATEATLNVKEIAAPAIIKGAIWTVTKLEDTFGLFQSEMISEINEFAAQKCPQRYPG